MEDLIVTKWTRETPTECGLYVMFFAGHEQKYIAVQIADDDAGQQHVLFGNRTAIHMSDFCVPNATYWLPIEECPNA